MWTQPQATEMRFGTAAAFIFFNSISGLSGNLSSMQSLPPTVFLFSGAVLIGVLIGTQLGLKHLNVSGIQKALGAVLIIADCFIRKDCKLRFFKSK